jgi:segregation and condensation protein B
MCCRLPARLTARPTAGDHAHRAWRAGFFGGRPAESAGDDLDQKMARIEAILFLAREPLSSRKLSQHANLADGTEARTLVRRLNERLDRTGRAFRVYEVAGGFQLTTRRKFAKWLRRLDYIRADERLSAPSLETLAVVAYRQPVTRAEIESIRGVGCGEILNQLMSRELVRVGGRSSDLGRPYLYNTTKRFLQLFGLKSLEDLPRAETFRQATVQPQAATPHADPRSNPASVSEVEEESDVSVSVELEEHHPQTIKPTDVESGPRDERHVRMEDEDFDDEFEDEDEEEDEDEDDLEEEEEFEDEEDEFEDEEFEEEDEEFEDEDEEDEDEDEEDEDFEDEDEEFEEDEDFEEEELGEDEVDEEEEFEDEDEEEDDEWEEVEEDVEDEVEEEEEDEDEDWEDEDWEDEEEWEED